MDQKIIQHSYGKVVRKPRSAIFNDNYNHSKPEPEAKKVTCATIELSNANNDNQFTGHKLEQMTNGSHDNCHMPATDEVTEYIEVEIDKDEMETEIKRQVSGKEEQNYVKIMETNCQSQSLPKSSPVYCCICPYCSTQNLHKAVNSSSNSIKQIIPKKELSLNGEEKQVLDTLDQTIEQMEQINQTVKIDHESFSNDLEAELEKFSGEIRSNEEKTVEKPLAVQSVSSAEHIYSVPHKNKFKIHPIYKSPPRQATLIRSRIKAFEPDGIYKDRPKIITNWLVQQAENPSKAEITSTSPIDSNDIESTLTSNVTTSIEQSKDEEQSKNLNEKEMEKEIVEVVHIEPKKEKENIQYRVHIERKSASNIIAEATNANDNSEQNSVLPQCAIYAKVIDQIKKRQYLNNYDDKKEVE